MKSLQFASAPLIVTERKASLCVFCQPGHPSVTLARPRQVQAQSPTSRGGPWVSTPGRGTYFVWVVGGPADYTLAWCKSTKGHPRSSGAATMRSSGVLVGKVI